MDKIKEFFSNVWAVIVLVLGAVIGGLLYYINLKQRQANAMAAQIALVQTQRQADVLEADIREKMQNKSLLAKEVADHQKALDLLQEKRNNLPNDNLTDKQIDDVWNKK